MDRNRQKYVGREFLKRCDEAVVTRERYRAVLNEFCAAPADHKKDVANGLLAIAVDRSEIASERVVALVTLITMVGPCGVVEDEELAGELEDIVDYPVLAGPPQQRQYSAAMGTSSDNGRRIQYDALTALIVVSRSRGLRKLDQLLELHADSEFGRQLRDLRDYYSLEGR